MENESDGDTKCNWHASYSYQKICKGTRGLGNKRTSGDHPNYSIVEIGQNSEKCPGNYRILAVTQTSVENHQLTLVWKTHKWVHVSENITKRDNKKQNIYDHYFPSAMVLSKNPVKDCKK